MIFPGNAEAILKEYEETNNIKAATKTVCDILECCGYKASADIYFRMTEKLLKRNEGEAK